MADTVYIGNYDNTVDFQLSADGSAVDLTSTTQIDAFIDGISVVSTNQSTDSIRWSQAGYSTGEIRCKFGGVNGLSPGLKSCYFIAYDPINTNGIVFDPVDLEAKRIP